MTMSVKTFRDAGLEAKWSRMRNGRPCMVVRDPHGTAKHQRETWWPVDRTMWRAMEREGIREGFDSATLMADLFSMPA
jgi:hypothetical protein